MGGIIKQLFHACLQFSQKIALGAVEDSQVQ